MLSNSLQKRQIQIDGINEFVSTLKSNISQADNLTCNDVTSVIDIIDETSAKLINDNPIKECYYSIQDFALRIGVSVSTLRLWDKSGKLLPHHRTAGGHRVYSETQAVEYINK